MNYTIKNNVYNFFTNIDSNNYLLFNSSFILIFILFFIKYKKSSIVKCNNINDWFLWLLFTK